MEVNRLSTRLNQSSIKTESRISSISKKDSSTLDSGAVKCSLRQLM